MPLLLLYKGILVGLAIAAPVGPIGVLCIRTSLAHGMRMGFMVGLGAATADAFYGSVAGFGLAAIAAFLKSLQFWLMLCGGIFLCYLGVRTFVSKPPKDAAEARAGSFLIAYVSTFLLTLANPATIVSFISIFASLGLAGYPSPLSASALVLGVFIGSALWWLFLSAGVAAIRRGLSPAGMRTINRLSGCFLFALGVYAIFQASLVGTLGTSARLSNQIYQI